MSFENNIRSFAHAAHNCHGTVFQCEIRVIMDGIQITMEHKGKTIQRRALWHNLALARAPWGQNVIDDMKQQIIAHARIK